MRFSNPEDRNQVDEYVKICKGEWLILCQHQWRVRYKS